MFADKKPCSLERGIREGDEMGSRPGLDGNERATSSWPLSEGQRRPSVGTVEGSHAQ